jgi:hypothetical protein
MVLPQKCKEQFLDGVTDAYVYAMDTSIVPVPFSVAQILSINNCVFSSALLHITTTGDESGLDADDITAKTSVDLGGNGMVFAFEVSATVSDGNNDNVREACKAMRSMDCLVVLCKADGTLYLCYTLPGTFSIKPPDSITQSAEQHTLTISLKSLSAFIPIMLKD